MTRDEFLDDICHVCGKVDHIGCSTASDLDSLLAAARREGRDAGLREAVSRLTEEANTSGKGMLSPYTIATVINEMITCAPPPKVKADDAVLNIALASENAKLRAVAEAARHAMSVGPDIDADVALMGALDAWRKDWRTK